MGIPVIVEHGGTKDLRCPGRWEREDFRAGADLTRAHGAEHAADRVRSRITATREAGYSVIPTPNSLREKRKEDQTGRRDSKRKSNALVEHVGPDWKAGLFRA